MGSGFSDWIYWHFLTITVTYNSSHIELLLNDSCLTNPYEESLTNFGLIFTTRIHECTAFLYLPRNQYRSHHVKQFLYCHRNAFVLRHAS
jgi:hypothetical protein